MLERAKLALRITSSAFDSEINDLISAALADLGLVGINEELLTETTTDPLVIRAVITYVRLHFGAPADYERLRASYDEQKAQMITATGYGLPEEATDGSGD